MLFNIEDDEIKKASSFSYIGIKIYMIYINLRAYGYVQTHQILEIFVYFELRASLILVQKNRQKNFLTENFFTENLSLFILSVDKYPK